MLNKSGRLLDVVAQTIFAVYIGNFDKNHKVFEDIGARLWEEKGKKKNWIIFYTQVHVNEKDFYYPEFHLFESNKSLDWLNHFDSTDQKLYYFRICENLEERHGEWS